MNYQTAVSLGGQIKYEGTPGLAGGGVYGDAITLDTHNIHTTGSYYLIFDTDETFAGRQPETDSINDTAVLPVTLIAPDLTVQNLCVSPVSPITGNTLTYSW